NEENERASRNERTALRNLYLSQMGQAHLAWKDGQVGRVLDLLDAQEPQRTGGHDFRGFEWDYLRRLCQAGHTVLMRQQQSLVALAYSPDGKIVASISSTLRPDGTIKGSISEPVRSDLKLWDAATGKELRSLEFFCPPLHGSIAFSPDSMRIAAFGE